MTNTFRYFTTSILAIMFLVLANHSFADVVDIEFGVNTKTVSQLIIDVVDEDDNMFTLTQSTPDTTNSVLAKTAYLKQVTLLDGTVLEDFAFLAPTIVNQSFPATGTVEVFSGGSALGSGDAGFSTGLSDMHSNGDLASYIRVDGTSTDSLWQLDYGQAIDSSGYFVVQERNGNTDFSIVALDVNGDEIGDTLAFDAPSYQWDTAIKNHLDPNSNAQTQELSIIEMSLFNTTSEIHGFSIVNSGNADFKFFFGNVSAVPEPGGSVLLLVGLIGLASRRNRSVGA